MQAWRLAAARAGWPIARRRNESGAGKKAPTGAGIVSPKSGLRQNRVESYSGIRLSDQSDEAHVRCGPTEVIECA